MSNPTQESENRVADAQANQAEPRPSTVAYKGLDPDFRCRGHQYEVGQSYRIDGDLAICRNGFHACENPLDVWGHYPVVTNDGRLARYALVEQSGATERDNVDSKIASSEIAIKAEIPFAEFVATVAQSLVEVNGCEDGDARISNSEYDARIGSSGDFVCIGSSGDLACIGSSGNDVQIGSSGDAAQIGSSGNDAQIGSSGDFSRIGSSGADARIGSSGYSARIGSSGADARIGSSGADARIGSSGYGARIGSSGDGARIGSSGRAARIGSSGDFSRIGSVGDDARIAVEGANSVVASAGKDTTVTACAGTWVALAEYDETGRCIGFAVGCIGQDGLKPGVSYVAKGGKLVERGGAA